MSEPSTKSIPTIDGMPNIETGTNGTPDAASLNGVLDATTVNEGPDASTVNRDPDATAESETPDAASLNGTPAGTLLNNSTTHGTSALADSSVPSESEPSVLSQGAALPQETVLQGATFQETPPQGAPYQEAFQETLPQGAPYQGAFQEMPPQGAPYQGAFQETPPQGAPYQGAFQETFPQGAHQPVLSTPPYMIPQHSLRLRMKVWTDPRTHKRYLLPVAFMRDLVRGQPVTDVMYSYAIADGETRTILLRASEWNSLPFFYFQEDGFAPR